MTAPANKPPAEAASPADFIREIVAADVEAGRTPSIHTRFPPEPNGFLHIGHAKSICLNFGIAREFGGICNLRMDDTNPAREEDKYVQAILEDVRWLIDGWADHCLGFKPRGATPEAQSIGGTTDFERMPAKSASDAEPFYASDYFDQLHGYAVRLIELGKAYVCDLSAADTDRMRGAPDKPGIPSPWRDRTPAENLDLFARMKAGEFPDGTRTLRARIDMANPNVWLRDPLLYRIRHTDHHHVGKSWRIYPLYDFAHCLSDYIEGITHSLCTLEFEVHRPLYDWILESLALPRPLPRQFEFARLNLSYTVMSKRKLLQLVAENHVRGWDDPRLPTISGLRRRGVTASTVRNFARGIGVTKYKGMTDIAVLEHAIRDECNRTAHRRLAVLHPLKVVITNLPDDYSGTVEATNNPEDPEAGTRQVPLGNVVFIEHQDFMEAPPPKYFRLRPGGEVRLKYAFIIKCDEVVKDSTGGIVELRCTADLESKIGGANAARKVKGTIHWVSAAHAIDAEVRLYDRLFLVEEPDADGEFLNHVNPHALEIVIGKCEPSLAAADPAARYQFERLAYVALDPDSKPGHPIFNRTISLRDSWAKRAGVGM